LVISVGSFLVLALCRKFNAERASGVCIVIDNDVDNLYTNVAA
jgi:hypothetical protein